ncbi:hypothetical protein E4U43_004646 [Claviceps pusilla]|uniref:Tat pathway signal sequence n=1 Tax=Claviceps pusilla TaxID=123648 RepID=A0A9P7NH34_9HYPO|nr:hypothetical protein E4U43_004646 [Claviceps pusilla]
MTKRGDAQQGQHLLPGLRDDPDHDHDHDAELSIQNRRKGSLVHPLLKPVSTLLLLLALSALSFWAGTRAALRERSLNSHCAAHTSQWFVFFLLASNPLTNSPPNKAPLLRDVPLRYESHVFNGSFTKQNIYRQAPSPEVDQAWEDLGVDYRAGVISHQDGLASGLAPSFVQRARKYGGGFVVNVEGIHHLHCLNLLRKSVYFNYKHYKTLHQHEFLNDEPILQPHITHCLDTLRQVLMCNVDTGVLGQIWTDKNAPMAFPDFNTRHRCKDFNLVREWARKLQRPPEEEVPLDYLEPPRPGDVLGMVP